MGGGGLFYLQTTYLQLEARVTAAHSPNDTSEEDAASCQVFFIGLYSVVFIFLYNAQALALFLGLVLESQERPIQQRSPGPTVQQRFSGPTVQQRFSGPKVQQKSARSIVQQSSSGSAVSPKGMKSKMKFLK